MQIDPSPDKCSFVSFETLPGKLSSLAILADMHTMQNSEKVTKLKKVM